MLLLNCYYVGLQGTQEPMQSHQSNMCTIMLANNPYPATQKCFFSMSLYELVRRLTFWTCNFRNAVCLHMNVIWIYYPMLLFVWAGRGGGSHLDGFHRGLGMTERVWEPLIYSNNDLLDNNIGALSTINKSAFYSIKRNAIIFVKCQIEHHGILVTARIQKNPNAD